MKNSVLLLFALLSIGNSAYTQSISLQIGSRLSPNPFYWEHESAHKQLLMGSTSLYYQPKIGKRIEIITGLELTYTEVSYQYKKPYFDCTVGMVKVPTNIQNNVRPLNTYLLLGTNILLFASSNRKWDFWLSPSVRLGGLSSIRVKSTRIYEDGSTETFRYKSNFNEGSSDRYASINTHIGQETRFHFAEKFFASAKIWGGYEFIYLDGIGYKGISAGLQLGVGYKWQ